MASISKDPSGNRAVQFVGTDGRRRSVRLGKVSQCDAEEVKLRVERLAAAQAANLATDGETARWLAGVGDELHGRLAAVGLVAPRQAASDVALGQYLEDYRAQRGDVSAKTSINYKTFANRLLAFFDAGRTLRSITEAEADRWLVFLKQEYAGATVSKSVKTARQFWAQAIRDGLASTNPFTHLRCRRR
jgi:hypothetical protein